jgi:hypothetical protein
MKLQQLSVFLENKPGRLNDACKALADAGLNVVTLSLADTEQFGILRLIIREWEKAKTILEERRFVVNVTDVVAVEVKDRPGGLSSILELLADRTVSVEYMYAFTIKSGENAMMVFRFDDMDRAMDALKSGGVNVLSHVDIFDREKKAN